MQIDYTEIAYQIYNHVKQECGTKEYHSVMLAMKETIKKMMLLNIFIHSIDADKLLSEIDLILRSGKF